MCTQARLWACGVSAPASSAATATEMSVARSSAFASKDVCNSTRPALDSDRLCALTTKALTSLILLLLILLMRMWLKAGCNSGTGASEVWLWEGARYLATLDAQLKCLRYGRKPGLGTLCSPRSEVPSTELFPR
mmetsp:Transcript_34024/g.85652  ORF Transcript_34024/g.85652 Transcript_34024/m.85652 type:complete len:134 (-) Transcript_34024:142-543(-)